MDDQTPEETPSTIYPVQRERVRSYRPLKEYTGLFLDFADLDLSTEAILDFAGSYGLLHESWDEEDRQLYVPTGEEWQAQILALSTCVSLWDAIRDENLGDLAELIELKRKKVQFGRQVAGEVWYSFDKPTISTSSGNMVDAAAEFLEHLLHRAVTLRGSAKRRSPRKFYFAAEPANLQQALWLQFLLAVCEQKDHVQCQVCNRWFERSPQAYRSDREYCSDGCRTKAYRRRMSRAWQLAQEGRTIKQIAKLLGSQPATVEGWLAKKKIKEKSNVAQTTRAR
jgi:hypothetical protein